ncbi:MAG: SIS domain-containing protein [Solirubrobacteraceae bacterium]
MNGERMAQEMAEQPERLRALLARAEEISDQIRDCLPSPLHGTTIVARGSSDHAATYGRYLIETANGRPVSMAAPSLHTLYGVPTRYEGQLVVAVSQSGQTPEIVTTLRELCDGEGRGLAITNDPSSDLASAAEAVISLGVGDERAVPATKTVTAQMAAFAILARALGEVPFSSDELFAVPDWIQEVLDDAGPVALAAEALAGCSRLVVVARGYLYGAAEEAALKIKETCSLMADGYSSADLRHGPIAAVTPEVPVLALNAPGPAEQDMTALIGELRERGSNVLVVGCQDDADLPLPPGMPEALAPIVAVVRAQQLARALALKLGYDPDNPEGLSKVTIT